ncbi:hypothetical protein R5R35_002471 [Gryllus longicercus]|uniref:Hexosyltransferase n=1 Tax=Gryllus longicercus TaxID=2509291 RepID=A0AAN9VND7_9ORTH
MERLLAPDLSGAPSVAGTPALPRRYLRCAALSGACLLLALLAYLPALHAPLPRTDPQHAAIAGWARNRSRDLRLYVLPENVTTLLQPSWSCGANTPYLLVVVCSALEHAATRAAIRDTWGSLREVENMTVHLAFLVGMPSPGSSSAEHLQEALDEESAHYGDLVQENFVDSYNNLTLKTVFLLKWVRTHCAGARFIMKTDDDMFVNIRSLVVLLLAIERGRARALINGISVALPGVSGRPPLSPGPILLGALICGARPITNASNKWYAPKYMYQGRIYPNYLSGTGYVMSADAVGPLYSTALRTPFFHLEDVFLTGICARQAGLRPRDHPAFAYTKRKTDACVLRDKLVVTSHHMEQAALKQVWSAMQQPSLNCTPSKVQTSQKPSMRPLGRRVAGVRRPGFRCV